MESYGELLRTKREEKNINILVAARETNITKEYLEALETEDVSAFHGEAYFVGFLRNYAEYLDIPSETVLSLYHNKELQESAIPDNLIEKYRPKFLVPLIVAGSVAAAAGLVVLLVFFVVKPLEEKRQNSVQAEVDQTKRYDLVETLNARIYRGDQITVPSENGGIVLTVKETLNSLVLETPVGLIYSDLAEERELDIDGDTESDIIVYVSDISMTDSARGAEVRMLQKRPGTGTLSTDMGEIEMLSADNRHAPTVILEDSRAYPFTMTATFRGSCIFRYRSDNASSSESTLLNGEVVNVTSNNRLRMWISNSYAVSFSIVADTHRSELGVGRAGQVLAQDIRWIRTKEGRYQLVAIELD